MKKKSNIIFLIIVILLFCCGCSDYSNVKADDTFSKAMYEKLGAEEIYYNGKSVSTSNVTCYKYLMYIEYEGQLEQIVEAANEVLLDLSATDKIAIRCSVVFDSCGGSSSVFVLKNYSDEEKPEADYQTFQRCNIWGSDLVETIYNDPATYYNLPGIKELIIEGKMSEITEEQNIDWTEYYPDLEVLDIVPQPDDLFSEKISREVCGGKMRYQGKEVLPNNIIDYGFVINGESEELLISLIEVANRALSEEMKDNKIRIRLTVNTLEGKEDVVILTNYSDEASSSADYQTFQKLDIGGSKLAETIYNDSATYCYYYLPGIKHLVFRGEVAKTAEEQNIDWTMHFPDLENLEIISDEN